MRRGFDSCIRKKSPQYSCLKNPMDRGIWLTTDQRVEKSQTQLSVHNTWPFYHKKVKQYQSCFTDACSVYSEKATAPCSSTLAWKIPWMEEPGRLHSMGLLSRAQLSDFTLTFHFHALEKEMATHSSVLAWRIPGKGKPGGLPSMGSHRVRHD